MVVRLSRANSRVNEDDRKCWLEQVHPRHDLRRPPVYVFRNLKPIFDSHSECHSDCPNMEQLTIFDWWHSNLCFFFLSALLSFFPTWLMFCSNFGFLLPSISSLWSAWLWCRWCFWQHGRNHWRGERISREHARHLPQQGVMSHAVPRRHARPLEVVPREKHVPYQGLDGGFPY